MLYTQPVYYTIRRFFCVGVWFCGRVGWKGDVLSTNYGCTLVCSSHIVIETRAWIPRYKLVRTPCYASHCLHLFQTGKVGGGAWVVVDLSILATVVYIDTWRARWCV